MIRQMKEQVITMSINSFLRNKLQGIEHRNKKHGITKNRFQKGWCFLLQGPNCEMVFIKIRFVLSRTIQSLPICDIILCTCTLVNSSKRTSQF